MTDDIKVKGSVDTGAVNVATDEIGGRHYPLYKQAFGVDGEATLVDSSTGLPVDITKVSMGKTNELLEGILEQLKIMNSYNELGHEEEITEEDITT